MSELRMVAELMTISARTAPKTAGQDFVVTEIVEGDDLKRLAEKMFEFGERTGKGNFDRDGANVRNSDAVLLIAECLDDASLRLLYDAVVELGMTPLVEIYEPGNLARVLRAGARLVGVNNRDLRSFEVDLDHTIRLRRQIPVDRVVVGESGIASRADAMRLQAVEDECGRFALADRHCAILSRKARHTKRSTCRGSVMPPPALRIVCR